MQYNTAKNALVAAFSLIRLRFANAFEPSTGHFDPRWGKESAIA